MSSFTSRLLLASALVAVPATGLVAAPASAQTAAPAVGTAATGLAAKKKPAVVLAYLRTGQSNGSVKRYQIYLRRYAKKIGVKHRKINPAGVTGYYGKETGELTRAVTAALGKRSNGWAERALSEVSIHPNKKLVKRIGLRPVKPPVTAPTSTATSATAPAANAAWPAIVAASTATKPSSWNGPKLKHPRTGNAFPSSVLRWANLVRAVMQEHGVADKYLTGILAQIQQESSGDPDAVNNWDSNAKKGTPSKGLLQVILPTYQSYAKKGYTASKYQTVPYTNIWAALNYVKGRYGMSKFASWNSGYNQGY